MQRGDKDDTALDLALEKDVFADNEAAQAVAQVLACFPDSGRTRQERELFIEQSKQPVGRRIVVPRNVVPDFEKVAYGLRTSLDLAHSGRGSGLPAAAMRLGNDGLHIKGLGGTAFLGRLDMRPQHIPAIKLIEKPLGNGVLLSIGQRCEPSRCLGQGLVEQGCHRCHMQRMPRRRI